MFNADSDPDSCLFNPSFHSLTLLFVLHFYQVGLESDGISEKHVRATIPTTENASAISYFYGLQACLRVVIRESSRCAISSLKWSHAYLQEFYDVVLDVRWCTLHRVGQKGLSQIPYIRNFLHALQLSYLVQMGRWLTVVKCHCKLCGIKRTLDALVFPMLLLSNFLPTDCSKTLSPGNLWNLFASSLLDRVPDLIAFFAQPLSLSLSQSLLLSLSLSLSLS